MQTNKCKIPFKYGQTPNQLLYNSDISLKAKGLFAYIQSKPDNWDFSVEKISRENKESLAAVSSAVKELEKFGYLQRVKKHDKNGHWLIEYRLNPYPFGISPFVDNPLTENPTTEKPLTEKGVNKTIILGENRILGFDIRPARTKKTKKNIEGGGENDNLNVANLQSATEPQKPSTTTNKIISLNNIDFLITQTDLNKYTTEQLEELARQFSMHNEGKMMMGQQTEMGIANLSAFIGIKNSRGIDTYQNVFKVAKTRDIEALSATMKTICRDENEIKLLMLSFARYNKEKVGTLEEFLRHFKAFARKLHRKDVVMYVNEEINLINNKNK